MHDALSPILHETVKWCLSQTAEIKVNMEMMLE